MKTEEEAVLVSGINHGYAMNGLCTRVKFRSETFGATQTRRPKPTNLNEFLKK